MALVEVIVNTHDCDCRTVLGYYGVANEALDCELRYYRSTNVARRCSREIGYRRVLYCVRRCRRKENVIRD